MTPLDAVTIVATGIFAVTIALAYRWLWGLRREITTQIPLPTEQVLQSISAANSWNLRREIEQVRGEVASLNRGLKEIRESRALLPSLGIEARKGEETYPSFETYLSTPKEPIGITREEEPRISGVTMEAMIDIPRVNKALSQIPILTSQIKDLSEKLVTEERLREIIRSSIEERIARIDERIRRFDAQIAFLADLSRTLDALKERRKFCAYFVEPDSCRLWRLKTGEPTKISELECALCNTMELKEVAERRSVMEREFQNLLISLQSVFGRSACPFCKFDQYAPKFLAGWICAKCGKYISWTSVAKEEKS